MSKRARRRRYWEIVQEKRSKRARKPSAKARATRRRRKRWAHAASRRSVTTKKAVPSKKRNVRIAKLKIPKVFSFLDNPIETLETINELERILTLRFVKELEIDHSKCQVLGLCASVLMDVTLLAGQNRRRGNQVSLRGKYSKDIEVNTMLRGSGILKHLAHPDSILPDDVRSTIRTCQLFAGKASRIERSRKCDEAATKLTDYFNECLTMEGFELSAQGKYRLSALITEVIGNAEEHGGRWYTIGYFHQTKTGVGDCHIVLFNFGHTIYESLTEHAASHKLQSRIDNLVDHHQRKGFLGGLINPKWDREALVTVYALQEGVSRLSFSLKGKDRGNGTVAMIEFFTDLSAGSERMCLISGRSYILFDGKYGVKEAVMPDGEERRVIAFNDSGDLEYPPHKDYVWTMPKGFPGTLISIRFALDSSNLDKLVSKKN